jgi:cyclic beta-1,2-glucan synthetase
VSITEGAIAASSHLEEPIRAELFGAERLEQHAESLAAADRITEKPTKGPDLRRRVRENLG